MVMFCDGICGDVNPFTVIIVHIIASVSLRYSTYMYRFTQVRSQLTLDQGFHTSENELEPLASTDQTKISRFERW